MLSYFLAHFIQINIASDAKTNVIAIIHKHNKYGLYVGLNKVSNGMKIQNPRGIININTNLIILGNIFNGYLEYVAKL